VTESPQASRSSESSSAAESPHYKTPERIVFLPDLPKDLTGMVQRSELKKLAI